VHYIRKHLLNRTITSCTAYPDDIVYGKVGCSADAFEKAVTGRKVIGVEQQGRNTSLAQCVKDTTDDVNFYLQANTSTCCLIELRMQ